MVRTVLDSIHTPVVVVNATGCLEVATTRFPTTAWNVPWLHVAFENAAAAASGVETAYRALRKRGAIADDSRSSSSPETAARTTSACRRSPARSSADTGSSSSVTTTRRT